MDHTLPKRLLLRRKVPASKEYARGSGHPSRWNRTRETNDHLMAGETAMAVLLSMESMQSCSWPSQWEGVREGEAYCVLVVPAARIVIVVLLGWRLLTIIFGLSNRLWVGMRFGRVAARRDTILSYSRIGVLTSS